MRAWLLTNTTYGTWLPGDPRGSVTSVRDVRPGEEPPNARFEHDLPGEPYEEALPGLNRSAAAQCKGPPIFLNPVQAEIALAQFQETAAHRSRTLQAVAVMSNHFHVVVQVSDDPEPGRLLADFKAYLSRALNRRFGKPPAGTWWTTNGSKRKLPDDRALAAATGYVLRQPNPLVVWSLELGRIV
jgi:REP element-mobilizing transposase RayT